MLRQSTSNFSHAPANPLCVYWIITSSYVICLINIHLFNLYEYSDNFPYHPSVPSVTSKTKFIRAMSRFHFRRFLLKLMVVWIHVDWGMSKRRNVRIQPKMQVSAQALDKWRYIRNSHRANRIIIANVPHPGYLEFDSDPFSVGSDMFMRKSNEFNSDINRYLIGNQKNSQLKPRRNHLRTDSKQKKVDTYIYWVDEIGDYWMELYESKWK